MGRINCWKYHVAALMFVLLHLLLAGSHGVVWTLGLMFAQLSVGQANANAWKRMCNSYIINAIDMYQTMPFCSNYHKTDTK